MTRILVLLELIHMNTANGMENADVVCQKIEEVVDQIKVIE